MGYEYDAIPNDVDDYRRRREVLLQQIENLATFACKYGSRGFGLDYAHQPDPRWGARAGGLHPDSAHLVS
ncbi:hypothetical protein [Lysobacter capsici]|uniref:hypothetical protein n=1 Tax=Lysobacter capsici TaxID=435897 RepID=UPI000627F83A|nr:hypothetical protein [Lysobacter capsici]